MLCIHLSVKFNKF
uniref:Uncharacterized protein n=1 Tax=Rhizophora mucronata TaxID=61149 RepID=A0A2P2PFN2_RHIMU